MWFPLRGATVADRPESKSSLLKMACAVARSCLAHSVFASRRVKRKAARTFGANASNAFYRALFNVQSVAGFAALPVYGVYEGYTRSGVPFSLPDLRRLRFRAHWETDG